MKKRLIMMKRMIIILICLSGMVFAQNLGGLETGKSSGIFESPKGFLDSLLDPSKLSISHSYSMSFTRFGHQSLNQGLYLSTISYQPTDAVEMQLRIGMLHQPFGQSPLNQDSNGKIFIQRAMMRYQPTSSMTLTFDYQALPSNYYLPYRYRY
jgi:hypothetical protein